MYGQTGEEETLLIFKSRPKLALLRTKNAEINFFKGHSKGHTVTQHTQTEYLYMQMQKEIHCRTFQLKNYTKLRKLVEKVIKKSQKGRLCAGRVDTILKSRISI